MQDVLSLDDGKTWYLLDSQEEASEEGLVMANSTGLDYMQESGRLVRQYREQTHRDFRTMHAEELYVRRRRALFFSLRGPQGERLVSGRLPRGMEPGEILFVAYANHDPYVEHAGALIELGKLYGFDLRRGIAYPVGYPYDSLRGKALVARPATIPSCPAPPGR